MPQLRKRHTKDPLFSVDVGFLLSKFWNLLAEESVFSPLKISYNLLLFYFKDIRYVIKQREQSTFYFYFYFKKKEGFCSFNNNSGKELLEFFFFYFFGDQNLVLINISVIELVYSKHAWFWNKYNYSIYLFI